MTLSERLPSGFALSDGLDAQSADQLANVAQVLERSLPLQDPESSAAARERAAKARTERELSLRAALEQALPLLEAGRYDIQLLVVLLRLSVESGGLEGSLDSLDVLGRMLNEAWAGLTASLAERSEPERDKRRRKWARYIDAAFEQMYSWLARERERDERTLAAGLASASQRWTAAFENIEQGLAANALPVGRFDAIERGIRDLARGGAAAQSAPGEAAGANQPTSEAEGAAGSAGAAARRASARAAPLAGAADASRGGDGAALASPESRDAAPRDAAPRDAVAHENDGGRASDAGATLTELRVSQRFWELERRLAAFDALLARGEYEKAGIVESDLRECLEHFDVAAYFPGLFARYFEGCAAHGERLARHQPERGALRASALASLYRTDLQRFLELRDPSQRK